METDLEKNRQTIPKLMRSRWPGAYSEKLIRNVESLMERMIASAEEEAIPEYARGIDGVPHLFRVTRCLLGIAEKPPEIATILAVLGHDWDRCLVRTRVARDIFPDTESGYEAHKVGHAVVSALEFCGNIIPPNLFDKVDIQLARERIVFHEHARGGDPAVELIDAAECLAFFYVPNLNQYYRSAGEDAFRFKLRYMLPTRDSKYFGKVAPRVREAIKSQHLEKPIIPILQDFLSTIESRGEKN